MFAFFNLVLKEVCVRDHKVCIHKFCNILVNIKAAGQCEYRVEQHQTQCHGHNHQHSAPAVAAQVCQRHKVEFRAVSRLFVFGPVLSERCRIIFRVANGFDCRNRTGNLRGLADADKDSKKGERSGANEDQRIYRNFNPGVCGITRSVHQKRHQGPANEEAHQQADGNTNQGQPERLPVDKTLDLPLCCSQRF